ncbi:MAG: transglutaminaseTgpA domain-containing protein [Brachymonas sp.]
MLIWLDKLRHLPRDVRDTLFLLAVIGWVILPQGQHLPLWCSGLAAVVLIWRASIAWRGRPLPSKWWLLGMLILTIGATLMTHRTVLGRDAGVTLIVVLLTLKTLELRARRDAFVVFFLCFFTMLTNFFFSQSLLTAAAMMLALMGLLTALVNAHRVVGQPPLLDSLKTAGFMVLLGAPIMALLFVLFPRLAPLWGVPGDAMTGRSGLSAQMEVGTIAKLALDDSIALRIKWNLKPGQQIPPASEQYFRGPVLTSFDGRNWAPSTSRISRRFAVPPNLQTSGETLDYEVTMEPSQRPWIFVLEAATAKPDVPGHELFMNNELQWISNRPVSDLLRYRASSSTSFRHGPEQYAIGLQDFVELPAGFNPRTMQLAAEIRRDPRFAQANANVLVPEVMRRLREGGYTYTLEPDVFGQHTADEFWFDRKQGFCEHIASSFVILMRALDVPSRIVTGYQGGEINSVDGYWTVRQRDAHAWAEVWQPGTGWVRVDPTGAVSPGRVGSFERLAAPQGAVGAALGAVMPVGLITQLRATWEAINNRWNQWVLNYSQSKQLDLLKNLGFSNPSWEDLGKVLAGIVTLVGLLGAVWTLWELHHQDPWLRQLARARKALAQAGLPSESSTPPRTLAQQAVAKFGDSAQALHDWLLQLEALRYQPQAAQRGNLATLSARFPRFLAPASS